MDKIQGLLDDILADVSSLGQNGGLLQDLDSWNTALSSASATIASNVVLPIALVILALFWMLELYNTFMRASTMGGGNTYMMYTIVISLVKMFLCLWAVQNATTILNGLFGISSEITKGISNVVGSGQISPAFDTSQFNDVSGFIPAWITVYIPLLLEAFLIKIVGIVVNTIVAARFIELYIHNAFAAIPLTTLCYQELHGGRHRLLEKLCRGCPAGLRDLSCFGVLPGVGCRNPCYRKCCHTGRSIVEPIRDSVGRYPHERQVCQVPCGCHVRRVS